MQQVFYNHIISANVKTSGSTYFGLFNATGIFGSGSSSFAKYAYVYIPYDGRLSNLHVEINTAPGSGKSFDFKVKVMGTAGNPQVNIANSNTSGADNSTSIAVNAGDLVCLEVIANGTPTAFTDFKVSICYTADAPNNCFMGSSNSSSPGSTTTWFISPYRNSSYSSTQLDILNAMSPFDCTIESFYAGIDVAPGSGKQWTFSIYKNGSIEASSTVTIANSSLSGFVTGLSIDVAPGDLITIGITPTGTPAAFNAMNQGIGIIPDTPGESWMDSHISDGIDGSATEYNSLGYNPNLVWSGTENDFKYKGNAIGMTLKKFNFYGFNGGSVAPGNYSILVRKNGSNSSLGISYNRSSAGLMSDVSNTCDIALNDEFNIRSVPNSPNWSGFSSRYSIVQYIAPKTQTYNENPTFTDTFIRQGRKVLSETATITATMLRTTSRIFTESVTYVATALKMANKVLAEVVTYADSILNIKILSKVVSESVTYVDTLIRLVGKVFSENETYVDTPTTSGGGGSSVFKIKTGTYTGNGSDNRAITGIGFQPMLVWIKPKDTTANDGAMSWDSFASDRSFDPAGSATPSADMIQSFDTDGFTIGTTANVNSNGVDYVWVAMTGAASNIKTGSYVGNGTTSKIVSGVGFQPDLVIVKRNGSSQGGYYWSFGNFRYLWNSNNGASGLMINNSDGFEVLTTSSTLNANGSTYYYFCLKYETAWGKMASYTGNSTDNRAITGLGFAPDLVWIKSTSGNTPAIFRTRDGHSGDTSSFWVGSTADAADLIQSVDTDGFTLGTNLNVNNPTSYRYLALKSAPSSASYNTTLTETVTLADTFIRNAMRVLSESVTYIDVVLKTASRTLSEVVTYIDSVQTNLTSLKTKVLSEVVTFTDTIIRTLTRVLSESVTYIATFNTAYNVVISNSVTYVDTVLKRAGKTLTEAFSPIDTLIRSLTRILSESVTYTDIFASIKMRVITITNSFTLSDTFTKLVLKVILAVENVQFIDILKVYLNGVLGRWVQKFSSRGTSYNDKNAKRNTVYSDKYSKNNTDRWNQKYF